MRVDWCVSSWFRIKNTHSLTSHSLGGTLGWLQAVFGINFLRFDARSRLCAPRLGTGFAATVSRTPSPRIVEGPINSFHPSPSCSAAAQCADHPKHRR